MPEIHINGRSSSHDSSLEIDNLGTSYDTSSGLLVTAQSCNSHNAISTPTNTMDHDTLFCRIGPLIIYFCFALVIIIGIVFCLAKNRQKPKTQRKHGTKLSFQMEPLSPHNAIQFQQTQ